MVRLDRPRFADSLALEQISEILESLDYTVVVLDQFSHVQYINGAGEKLIGRSRAYVQGHHARDALPEFFGKSFTRYLHFRSLHQSVEYEEYFPPLDLWTNVHLSPSPCGVLVSIHDISGKKSQERILAGQQQLLEMVAHGAPLPTILNEITSLVERQSAHDLSSILLLSEDGRFLSVAAGGSLPRAYHEALGRFEIGPNVGSCGTAAYTRRRVIVSDISSDPLWAPFKDTALRFGLRACWSQPILSTDTNRVLGTIANYSQHAGGPSRQSLQLLAIAAHLAQVAIEADQLKVERLATQEQFRAARDAAEKANKAKDRFLAILSHELRTPLSPALLIATSMARDPNLPPEARENLMVIERSIHLQSRLINDLLDLSRIENNKLSLQLQVVDLHEVLRNCLQMCDADVAKKALRVSVNLHAGGHTLVGDPLRLHQIFSNLIKNAAKFTPAGGTLDISTANLSPESIRVSVKDSGVGATSEVISRIFEPFEQGGRIGESQGLGLGLTICRGLTHAQGGQISAASDGPDKGMTFTVDFPMTRLTPPIPRLRPVASKQSGAPLRILLVEDHPETRAALSELLQRLSHDVTTADSVGSALAAAEAHDFDLIISDLGLPDGTGTGLMKELLKRKPLKGIALSGYGMESDIRNTREAGFFAHLTKPIDFDQLQQVINVGRSSMLH